MNSSFLYLTQIPSKLSPVWELSPKGGQLLESEFYKARRNGGSKEIIENGEGTNERTNEGRTEGRKAV